MPKLWLPLSGQKTPVRKLIVQEGGREMTILIPESGDKSHDDYLEEAELEKTKDELKKNPKPKSIMPRGQIIGALKEYYEYLQRKKRDDTKKYY